MRLHVAAITLFALGCMLGGLQGQVPHARGDLGHEGQAGPRAADPESAQAPQGGIKYLEREFQLPTRSSAPQGLDVLEVRADGPGRKPLVVLTHGTSNSADDRAHLTPWAQLPQALWFARRGYVALVVIRDGYGRSGGVMDGHGHRVADRQV